MWDVDEAVWLATVAWFQTRIRDPEPMEPTRAASLILWRALDIYEGCELSHEEIASFLEKVASRVRNRGIGEAADLANLFETCFPDIEASWQAR